jgi:hypothetical protein
MPIISIKTYIKFIYPFEDITDQFNSSDWIFNRELVSTVLKVYMLWGRNILESMYIK